MDLKKELSDLHSSINNPIITLLMCIIALAGFIVAVEFILIVADRIVDYSLTKYDNSTASGLYANSLTNTTIAFVTTVYVFLTGLLVIQSQKQQKQFHDEQRIRDIEKRLELFYMPAQSIMKVADEYIRDPNNIINVTKINNYEKRGYEFTNMPSEERASIYAVKKLEKIEQYRYLAKEKTCKLFTKYLYEEESNENRLELSNCIQTDIRNYLVEFNKLKKINEQIER